MGIDCDVLDAPDASHACVHLFQSVYINLDSISGRGCIYSSVFCFGLVTWLHGKFTRSFTQLSGILFSRYFPSSFCHGKGRGGGREEARARSWSGSALSGFPPVGVPGFLTVFRDPECYSNPCLDAALVNWCDPFGVIRGIFFHLFILARSPRSLAIETTAILRSWGLFVEGCTGFLRILSSPVTM